MPIPAVSAAPVSRDVCRMCAQAARVCRRCAPDRSRFDPVCPAQARAVVEAVAVRHLACVPTFRRNTHPWPTCGRILAPVLSCVFSSHQFPLNLARSRRDVCRVCAPAGTASSRPGGAATTGRAAAGSPTCRYPQPRRHHRAAAMCRRLCAPRGWAWLADWACPNRSSGVYTELPAECLDGVHAPEYGGAYTPRRAAPVVAHRNGPRSPDPLEMS